MKVLPLVYPRSGEQVLPLVQLSPAPGVGLSLGTARFRRGERVPKSGTSRHDAHEVSIVLQGRLEVEVGQHRRFVGAGEVTVLEQGEEHSAVAVEDTELLWLLCGPEGAGS